MCMAVGCDGSFVCVTPLGGRASAHYGSGRPAGLGREGHRSVFGVTKTSLLLDDFTYNSINEHANV